MKSRSLFIIVVAMAIGCGVGACLCALDEIGRTHPAKTYEVLSFDAPLSDKDAPEMAVHSIETEVE